MFTMESKEIGASKSEISMGGVNGDILQKLIDYCYGGEIEIDASKVEAMTKAADRLQFTEVKGKCIEFLSTTFSETNCLRIQQLADLLSIARLKCLAHDFILKHFIEVSKCDQFQEMSFDQLSVLLEDFSEMNIPADWNIYDALMRWVKHDAAAREHLVETILSTDIREHCTEFFSTILNASNCLGIRQIADRYNMVRLRSIAHTFVLQHFMEVFKCEEFYQLSIDQLQMLLTDDHIHVETERDVFEALMGWVKFDVGGRRRLVTPLLKCVRLQHVKESVSVILF